MKVLLETRHYQPQTFEIEEHLFRISQEALNNIQKHARATQIWLTLESQAEGLHLTIRDDGIGFSVEQAVKKDSAIGLKSMRERAETLGAMFVITSAPGQGTTLALQRLHS
jgi:signal transduction histidine kinase